MTNEKKLENLYTVARHIVPERYTDLVKKPESLTSDFIAEVERLYRNAPDNTPDHHRTVPPHDTCRRIRRVFYQ